MSEGFPLGVPTNRPKKKTTVQVPGRPNWWRGVDGVERYVEPLRPGPTPAGQPAACRR